VKFKSLNLGKALMGCLSRAKRGKSDWLSVRMYVCVTVCRDISRRRGAWEISSIHSQGSTPIDEQKALLSKRLETS